jgi:Amt family ammonium transporter
MAVGERIVSPSASIGIATNQDESLDMDMLMRHADIAMYAAKRSGPGEFALFEASMREAAVERLELEADLRRAVDAGEIVPHYQAIFDLTRGTIVGFEALARWVHPTRGIVAPGTFLPVAEQTGLVARIDEIMLRQATAQLAAWNADRGTRGDRWMSVNLAARQLTCDIIVDVVSGAIAAAGLAPDRLVLELTESSVGSDPEASARTLERLRELGLRLAIDDFGTGYSSLGQLQRFPFDILKVDRSFVAEPDTANALAPTIIDLANRLNLTTIAEGIETPEQLERVQGLGCGLGQGFLMHRPATAEAVTRQLRADAGAAKAHEHRPSWAGALAS